METITEPHVSVYSCVGKRAYTLIEGQTKGREGHLNGPNLMNQKAQQILWKPTTTTIVNRKHHHSKPHSKQSKQPEQLVRRHCLVSFSLVKVGGSQQCHFIKWVLVLESL